MNSSRKYKFFLFPICIAFLSNTSLHNHYNHFDYSLKQKANLVVHFKAVVNGEPLVIKKNYSNTFHEPFTIEKFRFYVGKISLRHTGTNSQTPVSEDNYFLLDFSDSSTTSIQLSVEPDQYSEILFLLGVDSLHNVSGAQSGALDPLRGMFWTWNSGYIMLKLEGSSPLSNQPGHAFAYHIGGYREPNNAAKYIHIPFGSGQELTIGSGKINELTIITDISKFFSEPNPLRIKEIPVCTTPGSLAKSISENYASMFSIKKIINE
jgi:hypothetical protein